MKNMFKKCAAALSAAAMTAVSVPYIAPAMAADTEFPFTIQGEDMEGATLWTSIYNDQFPGYEGEGFSYITGSDTFFNITVPEDGMYRVTVRAVQILDQGGREQTLSVNGVEYKKICPYYNEWTDVDFGIVRLKAGENKIGILNKYGYMAVDKVTITKNEFPDIAATIDTVPCDPDATDETKALMKYLSGVYGKGILSGQQEIYGNGHEVQTDIRYDSASDKCVDGKGNEYTIDRDSEDKDEQGNKFYWHCTGADGKAYTYSTQNHIYVYQNYDQEFDFINDNTGAYPAIRGFDFMNYNPLYGWDDGTTQRAIEWVKERGGIATACWHINIPSSMADYEIGEAIDWSKCTYKNGTDFKVANAYVEGTKENAYLDLAIEDLAEQLLILQENNVPLLFRPFHEAEGNGPADGAGAWFWWSQEGAEVYKKLWDYLYDQLTNKYGVHNLIWQQNLYAWSDASAEWYSGPDKVDIVGFDKYDTIYNRHDGKTSGPNEDCNSDVFWALYDYTDGKKMTAIMENSTIPSLSNIEVEKANWLYFCTWYDNGQDNFISGENFNNMDTVKEMYQSDFCVNLDDLPEDLYKLSGDVKPPVTTTEKGSEPAKTTTTATAVPSGKIVYGDANEDGLITVADATAILQAIGNPDKYGLSDQGKLNADCYNPGDGISGLDALAVQLCELKIIPSLPQIEE